MKKRGKNMIVAIHAYEDTYYGLHGIEDRYITEVNNLEEAKEIAEDLCDDVIKDYIEDDFSVMADGIYKIYKLKLDELPKGTSFSSLTLDFFKNKNNFLKAYGAERLI